MKWSERIIKKRLHEELDYQVSNNQFGFGNNAGEVQGEMQET